MIALELSDEEIAQIRAALQERNATSTCLACGKESGMGILRALGRLMLASAKEVVLSTPCAVLVCEHCGCVRTHHLKALGLTDLGLAKGGGN